LDSEGGKIMEVSGDTMGSEVRSKPIMKPGETVHEILLEDTERIDIDHYFMKIAEIVKERSTCVKQKVGAVLVKDKHIISTGYNGAPKGVTHCTKETCLRQGLNSLEKAYLCRGAHAEANAIAQAAFHGVSTKDSVIYCTHFPCMSCSKLLINSGVKKIYYAREYDMDNTLKMNLLKEAGVETEKVV
jgi:dCMP deaminase